MGSIKLEAGKYYRTRDGRKAKIHCIIQPETGELKYPCIGEVKDWSGLTPPSWRPDGSFDCVEREFDLVAEWKEPKRIKGWVNIYAPRSLGCLFDTKEDADIQVRASDRIACIEIDVLEGQGLDGSAR